VPFVPTEADIDQLISGSGRVLSTFLQFLKETGARSSEAAQLVRASITPEKGSRARVLPISHKLMDMLNNHPKQSDKIFATLYSLKSNLFKTPKSIAFKLQNPRLKEIGLHTFRHWKATTEYHKTRDILHVQQLLGHRDLRNRLIYINLEKALFQNADEEFHVLVAQNLDEACKLLEVGFEYVTDLDGAKLFRKRK
jgi:integrase